MDARDKNSFSIDCDTFFDCEPTLPGSQRPSSASAHAQALRRQSFSEIGETPPRLRLTSLPTPAASAAAPPPPPSPLVDSPSCHLAPARLLHTTASTPTTPLTASTPRPRTPPTSPPDTPRPTPPPTPSPQTSPNTNRSGKKRRLAQSTTSGKRGKKMAEGRKKDDDDSLAKIAKMIKGLESKIEQSETRTALKIDNKIDGLAASLGGRMDKVEAEVTTLAESLAAAKSDLDTVAERTNDQNLRRIVRSIVGSEGNRRPRPLPPHLAPDTTAAEPSLVAREERFLKARRQLRLWPVVPQDGDLEAGVVLFLQESLFFSEARAKSMMFQVHTCSTRADSPIQDQVLVTFESVRERDEVRSKASNLRAGDRTTGCQLEPPDHLRAHYQAFQNLAFCLKKKTPNLKRNIKFDDVEKTLIMDVKIDDVWKTVHYAAAKNILKSKSSGSNQFSRQQLKDFLSNSDLNESSNPDDETGDSNEGDDVTMTDADRNKKTNSSRLHSVSFINTNARSIKPKLQSLADCFQERSVDVAAITETWLQTTRDLEEFEDELAGHYSLGIITRERTVIANNGRQYGGVALAFKKNTTTLERYSFLNPSNFEVLAAVGKIKGIKGKVFVVVCYAPPNIPSREAKELTQMLSDLICQAKRTYDDCSILIMGDFNQWSTDDITQDHPDITEVVHGPTRGDRCIDRSFCNFGRSIIESGTLPPLETSDSSRPSDHLIAYGTALFHKEKVETTTYVYRPFTESGADHFTQAIRSQTWTPVLEAESVDEKVGELQAVLDKNLDLFFPLKKTTRRKSDPPWINHTLRRLWAKRRRVYDKEGRSRRWKALKKKSSDLYRLRAQKYMDTQRDLLTGPDASRNFFRNVRAYSSKEKPSQFDVSSLFPDLKEGEVAERLAEHFNKISKEFDGLRPDQIPAARSLSLPVLTRDQVERKLVSFKKPKSMVPGDIFPALVNRTARWLSVPLTDIYNCMTVSTSWPAEWKTEYVTPIPKTTLPQSPNDLRNISCTKLFSKVYESFVLTWLGEQASLRANQYGGVKGMGTEHFLINLWQGVLENIDDSRAGSFITSIDYSKAFNRLDFSCCLKSLQSKGVCRELLQLIASFLTNRNMTVKVGTAYSLLRSVEGGVPQGSLLGVLLFNATIDSFEAFHPDVETYGPPLDDVLAPDPADFPPEAPVIGPVTDRDHKHLPPFLEAPLQVLKYVDDNVLNERINFDKIRTDGSMTREYHATRTQNAFQHIVVRAEHCGMKVNTLKTNCMLVSDLKSYNPKSFFFDSGGARIEGKDEMKILGVLFSSSPDMSSHVANIRKKFRSRMWVLRHLGHRGFSSADLLRVYKSTIVPIHDYCSVVYHSSLTQHQSDVLERLQAQALKCIYGYDYSYRALLQMTGLSTLKVRRENRCDKFTLKCSVDRRFSGWFPLNPNPRDVRQRPMYKEYRARTNRLYNSPLFDLRRRLNRMSARSN